MLVPGGQRRGIGRRPQRRAKESRGRPRVTGELVGVGARATGELSEGGDQLRRRVGQRHRPGRPAEGRHRLREARDGVVGMEAAAVGRASARHQPDPDECLLPHLQQVGATVVDADGVSADLADRLGRTGEPLGAVAHHELRAFNAAVLLVGEEHQDEVTLWSLSRAEQVGDRGKDHRVHVLHVHRSPSPEHAVAHLAGEGIHAPVLRHRRDDVEVSVQHEGRSIGVSTRHPGHHVGAPVDGFVVLGLQAQRLQECPDVLRRLALAAGSAAAEVGGVEPDEVSGEAGDFGEIGSGRRHAD